MSINKWIKEFSNVVKIDYIKIKALFNMWDDYEYDDKIGPYSLKSNAVPYAWTANGHKFSTLDELIVWLQLNCINDENLILDMRDKEEKMFMDAWREANR